MSCFMFPLAVAQQMPVFTVIGTVVRSYNRNAFRLLGRCVGVQSDQRPEPLASFVKVLLDKPEHGAEVCQSVSEG